MDDGRFCGWQMNCNRWQLTFKRKFTLFQADSWTLMTLNRESIWFWWTINGYCSVYGVRSMKRLAHFITANKHSVIPCLIHSKFIFNNCNRFSSFSMKHHENEINSFPMWQWWWWWNANSHEFIQAEGFQCENVNLNSVDLVNNPNVIDVLRWVDLIIF